MGLISEYTWDNNKNIVRTEQIKENTSFFVDHNGGRRQGNSLIYRDVTYDDLEIMLSANFDISNKYMLFGQSYWSIHLPF